MNDLEELLSSHLTEAAEAADLTPPEQASVPATVTTRRRRRRRGYVVAAAAVTLLIAGVAIAGLDGSDDRSDDPVLEGGGDDNPTVTTSPSTAPPQATDRTTSTTSTTAPPPVSEGLVLAAGGFGSIDLGASFDDVLAAVSERLGEPTVNTGSIPFACDGIDLCRPGVNVAEECGQMTYQRSVEWGGLHLGFYGSSPESLTWWAWRASADGPPVGLTTPEGLGVTDPLDRWRETYGEAFRIQMFQEMSDGAWLETVELTTPDGPISGLTEIGAPPAAIDTIGSGTGCMMADY